MMDRMDTDDHSGMVYLVAVFKETLPISNSPSLVDASEEERPRGCNANIGDITPIMQIHPNHTNS